MLIKNFKDLAINEKRKKILEIVDFGLEVIQPEVYLEKVFRREGENFYILDKGINLNDYKRVFLIGVGKGSAGTCKFLEELLFDRLEKGFIIDVKEESFKKIELTIGTHPLPSEINFEFAKKIKEFAKSLSNEDLVFVVIYGGGSALLVYPSKISLEKYIEVNQALLKSGADIYEMNTIRKHLDEMKGGGLAKILYPAKVIGLIASDVPGNDLSFIASGPTVKDETSIQDALKIIEKYDLKNLIKEEFLIETQKELENVENYIILSNLTAINGMKEKAESLGFKAKILSDKIQGEVNEVARLFFEKFEELEKNEILIAGGETTVKVKGKGKGGRNQELALWVLKNFIQSSLRNFIFASINSDGYDNTEFAGAIVDNLTLEKIKKLNLNIDEYLENNDSFHFFKKVGEGIITGRLKTNVSDLMILTKF